MKKFSKLSFTIMVMLVGCNQPQLSEESRKAAAEYNRDLEEFSDLFENVEFGGVVVQKEQIYSGRKPVCFYLYVKIFDHEGLAFSTTNRQIENLFFSLKEYPNIKLRGSDDMPGNLVVGDTVWKKKGDLTLLGPNSENYEFRLGGGRMRTH